MILDWNDFGIDPHSYSSIVHGSPRDWFTSYGWDIHEAKDGSNWDDVTRALMEMTHGDNTPLRPGLMFGKTVKGRGYHVTGYDSHGAAHKLNNDLFWQCRADFTEKYGVTWDGTNEAAPADADEMRQQFANNLNVALDVLRGNDELVEYLANRLVELGDSVPRKTSIASCFPNPKIP